MSEVHPRIIRTDAGPKRLAGKLAPPQTQPTKIATEKSITPDNGTTRARLWRAAVLTTMFFGAVIYAGQQRRPIGPSAGTLDVRTIVSAVAASQPAKLRIGTYNIHGCKGTDGRIDLARIAGVLGSLDFIGLNEVHGPGPWEKEDQASALGRTLHMTSLFTPTEQRWWQAKFGNGLLSKLDVRSWQVVPLERRHGKSYRNLVHVRAKAANGTPLNILVTHIDRSDDRERHEQMRTVGEYFLALQSPAVLMGDLNSDAADQEIVKLLDQPGVVDVLGKVKGFQTPRHIDWILTRGLEPVDAGVSPVGPSDHAHIWADLIVPAEISTQR
ncbi:MAG: endonuclease/exonuclease/phosphatase family protein [Planctomycetia bacterium]|nr:endonuclease/exonuclease/phosphatase family protein [Planctomycetia bacterium]